MIIHVDDDFDLRKISQSGQCFRWESADGAAYRIPLGEKRLCIAPYGEGCFELDCEKDDAETWLRYFDLDDAHESYRAIRGRIDPQKDSFLYKAAEAEKGIRILRQDPWEATVSFIISQNRNIPAIRRSVELLCEAAGKKCIDGRGEVFYSFPGPEAILSLPDEALNECRLGYRARYVRAAAEAAAEGLLELADLPDHLAVDALTSVCGIGKKVAGCILLYGFHRLNSFPVDTWIRKVLASEYPDGYPFERYSPYNGVLQQYMFAYYRNDRQ